MKLIRNKYIQDLGIPKEKMTSNYNVGFDSRESKWKEDRDIYGFDERETWSLDLSFVEWLYSHLMMYVERCCVDLEFLEFDFEGKKYTQKEIINYILLCCKEYLLDDSDDIQEVNRVTHNMQKAIILFSIIFPAMWW